MYLDRYYVKHHSLPSLYEAGSKYFKAHVFDKIESDVISAIMSAITRERSGEDVDRRRIAMCVKVFEAMGMGTLDVYEEKFEEVLLAETATFYKGLSQAWIATDSTPEYLKKAEEALNDEKARVKSYLNPSTESKLLRVVEKELLKEYEMTLLNKEGSGCKALLRHDKRQDLKRMADLFSRPGVPGGLEPMAEIVKDHIQEVGISIVSQREASLKDQSASGKKKESTYDANFVRSLLAHHTKYRDLVENEFAGHSLFQRAMKNAFEVFVNKDVGKHTNADLISSFCDRILKTGGEKMADKAIETSLEDVVQLFGYLKQKDLFALVYRNQLAKRLLNGRSKSDSSERVMIQKLKLREGAQFTSSMEGMLNDLNIAADHVKNFQEHLRNVNKTLPLKDFQVRVLTTGFWPTTHSTDVHLPPTMTTCIERFSKWYMGSTSHRNLSFAYSLGNAVVRGQFKKWYDMQVSTLQAILLLRINEIGDKIFTYGQIKTLTNMKDDVLKRALHSLACGKFRVLLKDPKSRSIKPNDKFKVNKKFHVPMRCVRIPMASLEPSHNKKRVKEDRSIAIEAAIVRIMKARRVLDHAQLVTEVLRQLSTFNPDPKFVKQRIEHLIDREYLERDKEKSNTYHYLS